MSLVRKLLLSMALVMSAGFVLFSCQRVAERGRFALPYSTFGAGPEGTRGLLQLARSLKLDAAPFSHELIHLPARGTLVAIGGCDQPLEREVSRPESEQLMRWIEAGGLLIVAGADAYVPERAGLSFDLAATCEKPDEGKEVSEDDLRVPFALEGYPEGPPLTYALPLTIERARTVQADDDTEATTLIESDYGPLGMTAAVGRGRVVLLGSGRPFVNSALEQGGGVLFARLLQAFGQRGPVLFDEYHLGMGERRSLVRYLRDLGLAPALFQLAMIVLLFLLARGQRLGPPLKSAKVVPRVTQRYLHALGELYARTRDTQGALKSLTDHGLTRIARHYRLLHVPLSEVPGALRTQGLFAVASFADRVAAQASTPLASGESLLTRARALERDVRAALVVGDA